LTASTRCMVWTPLARHDHSRPGGRDGHRVAAEAAAAAPEGREAMTAEQTRLEQALAAAMNIVALTDERAKELVAEVLQVLLEEEGRGASDETINALVNALKRCCDYNNKLIAEAQTVCDALDGLARRDMSTVLTIKSVAKALRPALKVLANPHAHTAGEYETASRTVTDIAAVFPRDRLLSGSMRHELRSPAFRTLANHLPRELAVAA
jgi:hypothetical protein